ncbi:MAG: hypothetical protein WC490_06645 [Candidatus Margulisiibacteriota bacterium]
MPNIKSESADRYAGITSALSSLQIKLDAICAILLRLTNDEALEKWEKQDRPNMVRMLINLGFDNKDISRVASLTYGSVANIRSKIKGRIK